MPVAELEEKTKGKCPPLCHPRSFMEPQIQITEFLRERNHLTSESFHFFFPPIEGDCNQILSKARFPFFWKEECKESEAWVSFLFLFQGRRVQSPYLFQDRAKYLMSTCPSFSDRCFSKGNSPVLWFCHVSQGEGIFCLDAQNLMGRLHASINVWNSQ